MKILFIESKYHQKTSSSAFFKEILSIKHELVILLDNPYSDSKKVTVDEINKQDCDAVVFWQFIKSPIDIRRIKCKKIIWIPMYDGEIIRKFKMIRLYGYKSLDIKIISFSKSLSNLFIKNGINKDSILDVQYFPEIKEQTKTKENNVLFWQRREEIDWNVVRNIIGENKINQIVIKNNLDQNQNIKIEPTKEEIAKYNIKVINKWLDKDEYYKMLKENNIFIEPRLYEGIGMGFLDAMSYNLVVISPNAPTMNEYIINGYNGYLYDLKNPKAIDLSEIDKVRENLKIYLSKNYPKWLDDKRKIDDFLCKNECISKNKFFLIYILYGLPLEYAIQLYRKVRLILKDIFNN